MACYICAQEGKRSEAVAICIVCGMALCQDHVVREELPVWEKLHLGTAETRSQLPTTLPRFLCPACYQALHQTRG